ADRSLPRSPRQVGDDSDSQSHHPRRAGGRRGASHGEARHHGAARAGRRSESRRPRASPRPDECRSGVMRKTSPSCYVVLCYAVLGGVVAGGCDAGIKPPATITAAENAGQVFGNMSYYVTTAVIHGAHVRGDAAFFYSPMENAQRRP